SGLLDQSGFSVVMRQQLGLTFSDFRKLILKGFCNACVKRASRLAKQCAVGGILYERVLEQVVRVRRHTLLGQQACLLKTLKRRSELCRIHLPDGLYYGIRKFAAKGCYDLGHFSCWTQPRQGSGLVAMQSAARSKASSAMSATSST